MHNHHLSRRLMAGDIEVSLKETRGGENRMCCRYTKSLTTELRRIRKCEPEDYCSQWFQTLSDMVHNQLQVSRWIMSLSSLRSSKYFANFIS